MKEVLFEMSQASLGIAKVVGSGRKPIGVFTGGDPRRSIDRDTDIKITQIDKVMTTAFALVDKNALAVTAVELRDRSKVSALPVTDEDEKVVGAQNMP